MPRTKPGLLVYSRADNVVDHFLLHQDVTTLGRSSSCTIVIPLPIVSRLHALIEIQHDRYVISDSNSANGTFVNGKRIEQNYQLSTGDDIWLGSSEISLSFSDPEETLVVSSAALMPLLIDESAHTVQVHGNLALLSPLEYGLLLHLARHPGTVCTREACFQAVWGQPYDQATCEDALNACIAKLRRNLRAAAIESGQEPPSITTIPRIGFRLDATVTFTPRAEAPKNLTERLFDV